MHGNDTAAAGLEAGPDAARLVKGLGAGVERRELPVFVLAPVRDEAPSHCLQHEFPCAFGRSCGAVKICWGGR